MSWILTASGKRFDLINPTVNMICIEDIATALSKQCRYNGHCTTFYSVARHCVLMAEQASDGKKLAALMHDATEAYIGDMVKPLKNIIPEFEAFEDKIYKLIAEKYGLPLELPEEVKLLDLRMLATEIKYIMPNYKGELACTENVKTLDIPEYCFFNEVPLETEQEFLHLFNELYKSDSKGHD